MNNKLKIYLDTSVPNFIFADDSPEKKEITIDFFENFIRKAIYEVFVSDVVIAEIEDTTDPGTREKLLSIIKEYHLKILELNSEEEKEIQELAYKYIDNKIIPEKKEADALHIAICVIKKIDYLVSWNYKHLANINKENRIRILNWELGYRIDLRIITPMELIDYGS